MILIEIRRKPEMIQLQAFWFLGKKCCQSKLMILFGRRREVNMALSHGTCGCFRLFQESLHNAWEWNLGEEYIEDVRDAWDVLFSFIINKFSFGYKCYIADRDSEPQTTALQERTTDSTKE